METMFRSVLEIGITAGFAVMAVLLIRLLCKKAPKWITVALWALVGLRLIMPFSIEWDGSLMPSVSVPSYDSTPSVGDQSNPAFSVELVTGQIITVDDLVPLPGESIGVDDSEVSASIVTPQEKPPSTVSFLQVASVVWVFGIAAMLWYAVMTYIGVYRRVRTAVKVENGLYRCDAIGSPFVFGFIRPRIYVPYHLEGEELNAVLAHEKAHIKRGDHIIKPLSYLLLSVYWFQPLLWVAYIMLCRDIELACDERVVQKLDDDARRTYSMALVTSAVGRRRIAACPLAFGEVAVKERVKNVMSYKKPAFWIVLAAVVLCVAASVFLLTDMPKGSPYATFEGAKLQFYHGDMMEEAVPLSGDEDKTTALHSVQHGIFGFAVKQTDVESMSVTVSCDREVYLDGKAVREFTVPYDETVTLHPTADTEERFRMKVRFPLAADENWITDEESDSMTLHRYANGDTVLYLYHRHFWLTTGGSASTTINSEHRYTYRESNSWFVSDTERPAADTREIVTGRYEWVGDTLVLTEDGGLTRYVFRVSQDGTTLKHNKRDMCRHKRAHSPILKNGLQLSREYSVDFHRGEDLWALSYTLRDGKHQYAFEGQTDVYGVKIDSYADGVVCLLRESVDRDAHREERELFDLKNGKSLGVCSVGISSDTSMTTGYQPHVYEKDGSVWVLAQYVSWCWTTPDDNVIYKLEGLSSLRNGTVRATFDKGDLLICYTDDEGHARVIAEEIKAGNGTPMDQTLVTVSEFDGKGNALGENVERAPNLYYHYITDAAVNIDGAYVDVAQAMWDGTLKWTDLMALAEAALQKDCALKTQDETVTTYEFIGTDSYHTMQFVVKDEGGCDVHIGYIPRTQRIYYSVSFRE